MRASSNSLRVTTAAVFCVWALVCGLLGMVLTALWGITDHRFAHANENLLLFNPLWLVVAVMLPRWILRGRGGTATIRLVAVCAGLTVLALASHAVGLSRQNNVGTIGLALLPAVALWYAATRRPALRD